jgi:hypothetical protein
MEILHRMVHPNSEYYNWLAFQWINRTLREIDEGNIFQAATKISDALLEIHCTQGDPWEIIGQEFSPKKKKAFDSFEYESSKSSAGSVV